MNKGVENKEHDNLRETAKWLFIRLSDSISLLALEMIEGNPKWEELSLIRLTTSDSCAENEPWKDIFYIAFIFNEEKPSELVGMGRFSRNQIVLDIDSVPAEFRKLLNEKFSFGVIAVHEKFEKIKSDFFGKKSKK